MCPRSDSKFFVPVTEQNTFSKILRTPFIVLIVTYRWFSPIKQILFGPYARCRFHPTCSEYSLDCFRYLPFQLAIIKSISRIARCNPMHPGGHDPLFPDQMGRKSPTCTK
jgi:putative membrane protein insertion efficiency factor